MIRVLKILGFIPALCFLSTLILPAEESFAVDFSKYPQANELVDKIASEQNLNHSWVEAVIRDAKFKEEIIAAITKPAEKFPWYRYRKIFLTQGNVEMGVRFWSRYKDILERAKEKYGVDPEVIVAIIGVETRYGRITGKHRVIDSLITLALGYPRRSEFFGRELSEFMRLAHDEGLDPFMMKGSYAGAMGIPQFISSSYRNYAVDFNNNGSRDLLREPDDAIGSVANYLKEHGWELGIPIYEEVSVPDSVDNPKITEGLAPDTTYGLLRNSGLIFSSDIQVENELSVGVVRLESNPDEFKYRIGFPNFYVITKYNRSPLYAMAVAELSEQIALAYASGV